MRKTILYILWGMLLLTVFPACDRKTDENGDLDGMWQLTEWRDRTTNQVVKTKQDSLYYCVQLKLIKFQLGRLDKQCMSYFTYKGDSLIIGETTKWPSDEYIPLTTLAKYGVPADGKFHIDVLNSKQLMLSSNDAVLQFRKY